MTLVLTLIPYFALINTLTEWLLRLILVYRNTIRGFVSRNVHIFRRAYITYIRPLLVYASNVWSPHLIMREFSDTSQKELLNCILSYQEHITVHNLDTLEYWRLSSDLTKYCKVCHYLTLWTPSYYFNIVIPPHNDIMTSTFVSHCVVLIYLQMIS